MDNGTTPTCYAVMAISSSLSLYSFLAAAPPPTTHYVASKAISAPRPPSAVLPTRSLTPAQAVTTLWDAPMKPSVTQLAPKPAVRWPTVKDEQWTDRLCQSWIRVLPGRLPPVTRNSTEIHAALSLLVCYHDVHVLGHLHRSICILFHNAGFSSGRRASTAFIVQHTQPGAKAGIGVGVALVGLAVLAALVFLLLKRGVQEGAKGREKEYTTTPSTVRMYLQQPLHQDIAGDRWHWKAAGA
ncbi:MAG: hypothetical protein LQ344_006334 [Seirophora lacunosa]|nr:MAG: hypothetical protein LQ344_006334 [Seirophora lacunosa]